MSLTINTRTAPMRTIDYENRANTALHTMAADPRTTAPMVHALLRIIGAKRFVLQMCARSHNGDTPIMVYLEQYAQNNMRSTGFYDALAKIVRAPEVAEEVGVSPLTMMLALMVTNDNGDTPMHRAASIGFEPMLKCCHHLPSSVLMHENNQGMRPDMLATHRTTMMYGECVFGPC